LAPAKSRFTFKVIATLLLAPGAVIAEPRYLTDTEGRLLKAEVVQTGPNYFLRDAQHGISLPEASFVSVFNQSFYDQIQSSSPLAAATQSIFYLNAGAENVWNPGNQYSFFKHDTSMRILKLSLLSATVALYARAYESNRKVGQSIEYFNSDRAQARYRTDYVNYQVSASLTAAFFLMQAIIAYNIYGTNIAGDDLGILKREPLTLREYVDLRSAPETRLDINWQTNY